MVAKDAGVGIHNVSVALFYNRSALLEHLLHDALPKVYDIYFAMEVFLHYNSYIKRWILNCELYVLLDALTMLISTLFTFHYGA